MVASTRLQTADGWCELCVADAGVLPWVVAVARIHLRRTTSLSRAARADELATYCADHCRTGVLVNCNGDIAVRGPVPDGGWQVEIVDTEPAATGRPVISMGWPGGLATALAVRSSTESPDDRWHQVTVAARTCARASEAARIALELGSEAPRWLVQRELPARLIGANQLVLQTNGWPEHHYL